MRSGNERASSVMIGGTITAIVREDDRHMTLEVVAEMGEGVWKGGVEVPASAAFEQGDMVRISVQSIDNEGQEKGVRVNNRTREWL